MTAWPYAPSDRVHPRRISIAPAGVWCNAWFGVRSGVFCVTPQAPAVYTHVVEDLRTAPQNPLDRLVEESRTHHG